MATRVFETKQLSDGSWSATCDGVTAAAATEWEAIAEAATTVGRGGTSGKLPPVGQTDDPLGLAYDAVLDQGTKQKTF